MDHEGETRSLPGSLPGAMCCPHCGNPFDLADVQSGHVRCRECDSSFRLAVSPVRQSTIDEVRTIGRFQLLANVGQGSFGTVWQARDTELERVVALKVPHAHFHTTPEMLQRFQQEARAVAQLRHPGIVSIHEVFTFDDQPILVADFVQGVPLRDLIEQRSLTFREAATVVAEVAEALEHAHRHRLVHRDIKPGNIMIEFEQTPQLQAGPSSTSNATRIGKALIVDFGLARRDEAEVVMTIDGQIIGTPAYMSPEQAAGHGHQADARSDVYSLGVVFYQLLCRELPFRGSRAMILHQVINEAPRPPRRLNDKIPRDLETICLKAMAKAPLWRYQTAGAFAEDLRRYLKGEPIQARPINVAQRLWLWSSRNRALAMVSGLAIGTLLSLMTLSVIFALRERQNAVQLGDALRQSQYREAQSQLTQGLAFCEQHDESQGILWLARSLASTPPDGTEDLRRFIRTSLSAWHPRLCPLQAFLRHKSAVSQLACSPNSTACLTVCEDGTCQLWDFKTGARCGAPLDRVNEPVGAVFGRHVFAVGSQDGTVRRWDAVSNKALVPDIHHPDRLRTIALSQDGKTLLTAGGNGPVRIWDVLSGKQQGVIAESQSGFDCAAFSPDGKRILTGSRLPSAQLWEATSGKLLQSLPHSQNVSAVAFSPDGRTFVTGSGEGKVELWETASGNRLPFEALHNGVINSVAFSPNGETLLTGSDDKTARLWSLDSPGSPGPPLIHLGAVSAVAFSSDGSQFLTGSVDHSVRIWKAPLSTGGTFKLDGHGWIRTVTFSPDGASLLTAGGAFGERGVACLWDARKGKLLGSPIYTERMIWTASFSPDGRLFVIAGEDGHAQLAETATGKLGPCLLHSPPIHTAVFCPPGRYLLTGAEDRKAQLWNTETGMTQGEPFLHNGIVQSAAFAPNGDAFVAGVNNQPAVLWRLDGKNQSLQTLSVLAIAFSHDGRMILTGGRDGAHLWDANTGLPLGPPVRQDEIRTVAFSPDDKLILTCGSNGIAQLWDVGAQSQHGGSFFHERSIQAGVFSPSGQLVLTASDDHTAKLWDVGTGRRVGPILVHKERVPGAAFGHDGSQFATCSDQLAKIWATPIPLEDTPDRITLWAQVQTGLELDEFGGLHVLDPDTWKQRKENLQKPSGLYAP